ncbi:hypothetical protein P3W24_12595 [Luteibacter sp. PPL201]|uniref:Lipoprotein n=1 Tax=Luteibacter sahnii TaxID=3021977 RepID=A0ABT6BCI2_9GAMM
MVRVRRVLLAFGLAFPLAGCYYDPGYGYVRNGSGADVYYGTQTTTVVGPGYAYDPGFGYVGGYGYGPGCCYSGVGVGAVWYHDRYDDRRYRDWHRYPPPGGWRGGDRRPPPGGWYSHGPDRRPPPGGWRSNPGRGPGGWHGGNRGDGWHGGGNGHDGR